MAAFLVIKADVENGNAMSPSSHPARSCLSTAHYNSLEPYRRNYSNLYAVHNVGRVLIRYVEPQDGALLLRPQSQQIPLILIETGSDGSLPADQIIGRVCHANCEL
jgi:hypothetical protein